MDGTSADTLGWLIAVGALALAAGLAWLSRNAGTRAAAAEARAEEASRELDALRAAGAKAAGAQQKRDDDRSELRRKLEKARKRASGTRDELQRASQRIAELEAQLARKQADLEVVRAEHAPPTPAPVVATPPAVQREDSQALEALKRERDAVLKQSEELRGRASAAEARAGEFEAELEKLRHKAKTQDRLYLAMRGELDAKKDRVRAQTEEIERLRALRVALGAEDDAAGPADGDST